jgi:hypothetical protein
LCCGNALADFENCFKALFTPTIDIVIKFDAHFLGEETYNRTPAVSKVSQFLALSNLLSFFCGESDGTDQHCADSDEKHRPLQPDIEFKDRTFILGEDIEISKSETLIEDYSLTAMGLTV